MCPPYTFGMREDMTSVKVRKSTRDRLNAEARRRSMSADRYIEFLMDEALWAGRLERAARDMAQADSAYAAETAAWESVQSYAAD